MDCTWMYMSDSLNVVPKVLPWKREASWPGEVTRLYLVSLITPKHPKIHTQGIITN